MLRISLIKIAVAVENVYYIFCWMALLWILETGGLFRLAVRLMQSFSENRRWYLILRCNLSIKYWELFWTLFGVQYRGDKKAVCVKFPMSAREYKITTFIDCNCFLIQFRQPMPSVSNFWSKKNLIYLKVLKFTFF